MKLDQLRKIIREEVRAAVKEELQEVMNEAVKAASTPIQEVKKYAEHKPVGIKPSRQNLIEMMGLPDMKPKTTNLTFGDPIQEMLNQTKQSMSGEEYRNITNFDSSMIHKPSFASSMANQMGMTSGDAGLDISQLSFVKNAKKVLDLANEKSKNKL